MGLVRFSNSETLALIRENSLKKGDVLAVARIAAIQAVKKTPDIIPLAHGGVAVEGCTVRLESVDAKGGPLDDVDDRLLRGIGHYGGVSIQVKVETTAKTGVEMEALTGVVGAALTVVDMCKGVDKECKITGIQVLGKMGGRSGAWGIFAEGERVRKVLSMKRSGRKLGSQAKQRMAVEERRKEKHENAPTKAIKKPKQQQAIKKKQLNKEALNATQIEEAPEDEETGEKKSRPTAEHIESIGRKIERRAPEAIGAEEDEPVEKIVWKKLSFENKSKESG